MILHAQVINILLSISKSGKKHDVVVRSLCKAGDFGSSGHDVPLGFTAVNPDMRAADSGASGLSGCEEIAEAEPQAVDFPVGRAEKGDLQRIVMVGHTAGDEFQSGTAAPAEGNEAGAACVKRLAGFKSRGLAGETAEFLFEEIHVTPP